MANAQSREHQSKTSRRCLKAPTSLQGARFLCVGWFGEEYFSDELFEHSIFFHVFPNFWVFFFSYTFLCKQKLCEDFKCPFDILVTQ